MIKFAKEARRTTKPITMVRFCDPIEAAFFSYITLAAADALSSEVSSALQYRHVDISSLMN